MQLGRLTDEQMKRHEANPLGAIDDDIRRQFKIPEDRYYTVSTFPEKCRGLVYLDEKRTRHVKAQKISKSDQTAP